VACVGDETPFAVELLLDPVEHRVEGLAEAGDLVIGGPHRKPLVD
jgi:hypothetical protein